ncbi:unnamed protein product, partial [Prorocentrum cordatum]
QELKDGLQHVLAASREKSALLKTSVAAFETECGFVNGQLKLLPEDAAGRERMGQLSASLREEAEECKAVLQKATEQCERTQKYFSISEKAAANLPPCEQFFGHIAAFLDQLSAAWLDISEEPREVAAVRRHGTGQ